ncbi:2-amino-4-hydroxy-6-hydroxymethyldihydropteridine diphosphokinase [Candidatus Saccharibacteria bacterium]|nr:2-amino-4-hydroxy-6-hydroxymethyldihydropteridine diphosphokinase [Candidatus Saccharibacteria bacterium]
MIALGLGSNVGDRLTNLQNAVNELNTIGKVSTVSNVYETEPWGKTNQNKFLNACVEIEAQEEVNDLLYKIKQIEQKLGRIERERWGPREIDIDILFYHDQQVSSQRLTVPHPLLHERPFVLIPLREIAADFVHPILGKTISELAEKSPKAGIKIHSKLELKPLM